MIVLIGTNRDTGQPVEVGLYATVEEARAYVHKHTRNTLFSVWTPKLGQVIEMPAISGLSLPPQSG